MAQSGKGREYYRAQANAARKIEDAQLGQMLGAIQIKSVYYIPII